MNHPATTPGAVAVITGGAAGIGRAVATKFARMGLTVCIADLAEDRLAPAADLLKAASPSGAANVLAVAVDVSRLDEVQRLEAAVREQFGGTDILMNNAGVQPEAAYSDRLRIGNASSQSTCGASFMVRAYSDRR